MDYHSAEVLERWYRMIARPTFRALFWNSAFHKRRNKP